MANTRAKGTSSLLSVWHLLTKETGFYTSRYPTDGNEATQWSFLAVESSTSNTVECADLQKPVEFLGSQISEDKSVTNQLVTLALHRSDWVVQLSVLRGGCTSVRALLRSHQMANPGIKEVTQQLERYWSSYALLDRPLLKLSLQ